MKIITVPINSEASKLLDLDNCPSEMLNEIILPQGQFDKLWAVGFFNKINEIAGTMIDDFEDEVISNVESFQAILDFIKCTYWDETVFSSINQIENLFLKAKEYKTSVHFYF